MPIYITRGRYTREAIKGMIVKPEDRYESLSRHVARTGGRVLSYFMTFGDFLTVIEAPGETQMQPCCGSAHLVEAERVEGGPQVREVRVLEELSEPVRHCVERDI